jgi:hypothetical protein
VLCSSCRVSGAQLWRSKELGNHEHKVRHRIGNRFKTRQTGDIISTYFVNLTTLIVAVSRDICFNLRKNQYLEVLNNGVNGSRACVWPPRGVSGLSQRHAGLRAVRKSSNLNQLSAGQKKEKLAADVRVCIYQVHGVAGRLPTFTVDSLTFHSRPSLF